MWPQLASSLPVFDGLILRLTKEVEPQVYRFSGFNFRVLQVRTTLNLGLAVAGPLSQTFRFFARAYFSAIIPFENVLFSISEKSRCGNPFGNSGIPSPSNTGTIPR